MKIPLTIALLKNCCMMTSIGVVHFGDEKSGACHDLVHFLFSGCATKPGKPTVQWLTDGAHMYQPST